MIIQTSSNLITKRFLKDSILKIIESLDLLLSHFLTRTHSLILKGIHYSVLILFVCTDNLLVLLNRFLLFILLRQISDQNTQSTSFIKIGISLYFRERSVEKKSGENREFFSCWPLWWFFIIRRSLYENIYNYFDINVQ